MARYEKFFNKRLKEAHQLIELPRNLDYKAKRMTEIADELAELVAPESPCKKGCSYCCHMATMISSWEAEQIGKFLNKKIVPITGYVPGTGQREKLIDQFSGIPCPFLSNNECSIYQVRPFSCRMHLSMDNDSNCCDIIRKPSEIVPYFNFRPMEFAIVNLFLRNGCKFGDIREFFPKVWYAKKRKRRTIPRTPKTVRHHPKKSRRTDFRAHDQDLSRTHDPALVIQSWVLHAFALSRLGDCGAGNEVARDW